jgi:riboflavin synthase
MFSGIIEATGNILSLEEKGSGASLLLDAGAISRRVKIGDSIAVNGVCLTVTKKKGRQLSFDISAETWQKSNFSDYDPSQRLNLELPVTANTMLSGHFVQGHVEGVGQVSKWIRDGEDVRLFIKIPEDLEIYCVPKGSIAINGVSLTIASQKNRTIGVALIPYTLENTNLNALKPGDQVNIETDMIGRYVVSTLKKTYDKP